MVANGSVFKANHGTASTRLPYETKSPQERFSDALHAEGTCWVCLDKREVATGLPSAGRPDPTIIKCPRCFPEEYGLGGK